MEVQILEENKTPLFDRTAVKAKITYTGKATPSRTDILQALIKKVKAQEALTIVRKVSTDYGHGAAVVEAYVYDNGESLQKLESEKMKKLHVKKEEAKEDADATAAE